MCSEGMVLSRQQRFPGILEGSVLSQRSRINGPSAKGEAEAIPKCKTRHCRGPSIIFSALKGLGQKRHFPLLPCFCCEAIQEIFVISVV